MDDQSLRSELTRLQDREATLSHLLILERERRVRAEHLFEVERLACFQLGHQLVRHKVNHADAKSEGTILSNSDGHCYNALSNKDPVESCIAFKDTSSSKAPVTNGDIGAFGDTTTIMNANLTPFSTEDDFASSIFSQLPPNLQTMLGVGGVGDTQEDKDVEALSNAAAAVRANNPDTLRRYVSLLGLQNSKGKSLLEMSCERGHEGCVRVLLEGGWSPNEAAKNKWTPLHICAKHGHLTSLKTLLEFGAEPNVRDDDDQTPLFQALRAGHETTAQYLLQAPATSLTIVTKDGRSLLHAAVLGNLPHTLRLLLCHLQASLKGLEFKTILNSPDGSGSTPLHTAVSGGHKDCVGVLCACDVVGVALRDRWNRTPMDMAPDEECRAMLRNRESRAVLVVVESPDHSSTQHKTIGQLSVLAHHRLSDIELLIADLLSRYCESLRGHSLLTPLERLPQTHHEDEQLSTIDVAKSLSERIQSECELADALINKGDSVLTHKYLQNCSKSIKSVCARISSLDLDSDNVACYQVGSYEWRHGTLDTGVGGKTLLSVLGEAQPAQVRITLKGLNDACLDQLAFELMIPVAKLQKYIDLIERHKALIIHGPQGSGKTHLARALANYIKANKKRAQVVYVSLHPNFQRDDLFRLFHLNGLLSQQEGGGPSKQSHVVVLDNLSSIHTPSVLAELLTSLEYRGAEMWVNDVYGRDGSLLYPCGHYYLTSSSYFIATTSKDSSPGSDWVDQFAHVSLDLPSSSGVLLRHLNARLVHSTRELVPHPALPVCRMVWWVFQVWVLYNNFLRRIGLQKQAVGVRHFIQCPVESGKPEAISSWLVSLWSHHLAPAVRSTLLTPSSQPSQSHALPDFQLVSKCLFSCVDVVFQPCCPLSYEAREACMSQLREAIENEETEPRVKREETNPHNHKDDASTNPQSTISNNTDHPSAASHPAHKPPLPPQSSGSMVSYEDMLRDSPRSKTKHHNDKTRRNSSTKSSDSIPHMPQDNGNSEPAAVERVVLRPKSRNNTLRKIRAKTIGLFSKDPNGSSTLPKLFRRGSKQSLNASAISENLSPSEINPAKEARQMEDMFDLLTSANSSRFEDQRTVSPPPRAVSMCMDTDDKRRDLDNFLDMLTSVDTSRIDEQRSPLPPGVSSRSSAKKKVIKTVPKYTLPTESPLRGSYKNHPSKLHAIRGSSPTPAYSTPDIPNAVYNHSSPHIMTQPIERRYNNVSVSSYDSVFNDDPRSPHSTSVADEAYQQQDSPRSEPGSKQSFKDRAQTNDASTISEPLRRRKPPLKINTHSSVKSTPPHNVRSPASPLTMAVYSSPKGSPMVQPTSPPVPQVADSARYPHARIGRLRSVKATSVADITEVDELGTINDFDLFRAVSEGDLLQSSANDSFFDFSPTMTHIYEDSDAYNSDNRDDDPQDRNGRPSHSHQSSPSEEGPLETSSLKRHSSRTSGYVSDNHSSNGKRSRSSSYYTSRRRYSISYDQNRGVSTLNSLRRRSDCSGVIIGANLLYSASLGCGSLPRLNSSRDRLASICGSLTEDLTTEM